MCVCVCVCTVVTKPTWLFVEMRGIQREKGREIEREAAPWAASPAPVITLSSRTILSSQTFHTAQKKRPFTYGRGKESERGREIESRGRREVLVHPQALVSILTVNNHAVEEDRC